MKKIFVIIPVWREGKKLSEPTFCYFDTDVETRLSCSNCGKNICPKCMIEAAVGFKCPECANSRKSHIEEVTQDNYIIGSFSGLIIGAGVGFIWHYLSSYGILISLAVAYVVGLCISKAISASIGSKIGKNIEVFTGIITVISIVYNPIILAGYLLTGVNALGTIMILTGSFFSIFNLAAVIIAVWAAIRHFRI